MYSKMAYTYKIVYKVYKVAYTYKIVYKMVIHISTQFNSVQSLSRVQLFVTQWTAARQASPSLTNSRCLLKLMAIESVMPLVIHIYIIHYLSVQFINSVMSDYLRPHGLQHARPPFPSPAPRVYPNSCLLSQ